MASKLVAKLGHPIVSDGRYNANSMNQDLAWCLDCRRSCFEESSCELSWGLRDCSVALSKMQPDKAFGGAGAGGGGVGGVGCGPTLTTLPDFCAGNGHGLTRSVVRVKLVQ